MNYHERRLSQIYSYIYIKQCGGPLPGWCPVCRLNAQNVIYPQDTSLVGNTALKCFEVCCTLKDTYKEKPWLAHYLPETPSCVLQRAETGHFRLRRRREDLEEKLDTIKNLEGKLDLTGSSLILIFYIFYSLSIIILYHISMFNV